MVSLKDQNLILIGAMVLLVIFFVYINSGVSLTNTNFNERNEISNEDLLREVFAGYDVGMTSEETHSYMEGFFADRSGYSYGNTDEGAVYTVTRSSDSDDYINIWISYPEEAFTFNGSVETIPTSIKSTGIMITINRTPVFEKP